MNAIADEKNSAARARRLLAAYLLNLPRGVEPVRAMMQADILRFEELGAERYAAELVEALARFETAYPNAPKTLQ